MKQPSGILNSIPCKFNDCGIERIVAVLLCQCKAALCAWRRDVGRNAPGSDLSTPSFDMAFEGAYDLCPGIRREGL